jgi:fructan beta-fructosidase
MKYLLLISFIIGLFIKIGAQRLYHEEYRPQIHFTPEANWMNDPNGMVYHNGVYHLFYQYYPDSTVWGPNHWGHAISKDLVHWQHQPVALHPDSLGLIASGSAVVDAQNTSGFGKNGKTPLVAIYAYINQPLERQNKLAQYQAVAYSLDDGLTFTKYNHNPVVENPGIKDFRDPKVTWYQPQKKWIMTVAAKDQIMFYSSTDLMNWEKESDFGSDIGAHGGVWECPDLFTLNDNGKQVWVLVVNLNPGGPNKGSATQYFLGEFNGNKFIPSDTTTRWLDYGPDEYAGVTWSNTDDRKIFLGWMSNWLYANIVPTEKWRGAMTLPRDLKLKHINNYTLVASEPVNELHAIELRPVIVQNIKVTQDFDLSEKTGKTNLPCRLNLNIDTLKNFSVNISNDINEAVIIGYDKASNQYYIDRTNSGKTDFYKGFAARHTAPRFANTVSANLSLVFDVSSVELFADDGLTVMTETFFPNKPYNQIHIQSPDNIQIKKLEYASMKSIW